MAEPEPTGELTEEAIARSTREYYDARPEIGDAWNGEPTEKFPDIAPEQRRLEAALREVVRGRNVLEVACGTGPWTRFAAEVASSILAIDSGETCIRLAREQSARPNVTFQVADAFELAALGGTFTAGFAGGFFHLVPRARQAEFLAGFHARLTPGAPVFLCASHTRTARARRLRFEHPSWPDIFCNRRLKDGRSYVVVNNEFDEAELRRVFEPVARDLRVEVGDAWWWVTYFTGRDR
jgi:SAM-dependent methyltransferase